MSSHLNVFWLEIIATFVKLRQREICLSILFSVLYITVVWKNCLYKTDNDPLYISWCGMLLCLKSIISISAFVLRPSLVVDVHSISSFIVITCELLTYVCKLSPVIYKDIVDVLTPSKNIYTVYREFLTCVNISKNNIKNTLACKNFLVHWKNIYVTGTV